MPAITASRKRRGVIATAFAALALTASLTACAPAAEPDVDLESGDFETSALQWREDIDDCMLKAGFDLTQTDDNGSVDTSQFDMAEFDAAYAGCIDEVGQPPVDESQPTEDEIFEVQLVFAQCMRDAGYDVPDPVKGDGMTGSFSSDTNPDDVDACDKKANESLAK